MAEGNEGIIAAARVNEGMITAIDLVDIPDSALSYALNARFRYDIALRRETLTPFTPAKPDSNKVLAIVSVKTNNGTITVLRITRNSIYRLNAGAWTAITGILTGADTDRISVAVHKDKIVLANNGIDKLQLIDNSLTTFADLGNSFRYKYVTTFYDRIVGAYRTDGGSYGIEVGWSALGNPEEWDNSVDNSAGQNPIIDDEMALGNLITGIVGLTNYLVIPREKSIYVATKQASSSDPFRFYNALPGIGADTPYSITNILSGIAWLDTRTGTVWAFAPGGEPERIGLKVEKDIIRSVEAPDLVFGTFSAFHNELSLHIPLPSSNAVKQWCYNFNTKAWAYSEYQKLSTGSDVEISTGILTIDDLPGTIDDLVGTIDSLGSTSVITNTKMYGDDDGELYQETSLLDSTYNTELVSKLYQVEKFDQSVTEQHFEFEILQTPCEIELWFMKDDGVWRFAKSKTFTSIKQTGRSQRFTYIRNLHCKQFQWKLVIKSGQCHFLKYELKSVVGGDSRT